MHGPKPHKGLLKRIRITKSGKVKMRRGYGRHLRSHKSGKLLRKYRRPIYLAACELHSIGQMLHRRLTAPTKPGESGAAKSPPPAES